MHMKNYLLRTFPQMDSDVLLWWQNQNGNLRRRRQNQNLIRSKDLGIALQYQMSWWQKLRQSINLPPGLLLSVHYRILPHLSLSALEKVVHIIIISRVPHGFTASLPSSWTNRLAAAEFLWVCEVGNVTDLFCLLENSHTIFGWSSFSLLVCKNNKIFPCNVFSQIMQ